MIVRIARSTRMPTLYSYYISKFTDSTHEQIKKARPFSIYHRSMQEYEITPEIYKQLNETVDQTIDMRRSYPVFERNHAEKYGYQQDAVDFSHKTDSLFINFPQGTGKTLTALKILESHNVNRALIICGQGNLQEEWLKDAHKHNHTAQQLLIVGGDTGVGNASKIKWLKGRKDCRNEVHLINIEALRAVAMPLTLNELRYDCIIVDEVQSAKGWKAEQTKGVHELTRYENQIRIALSGTPVLNSPLEFFSLLKFLGLLKDTARTTFERFYGEWGFDFWGHYVCKGFRNLDYLKELLTPALCYADKAELNLPPKTRYKTQLQWSEPARFKYLRKVYGMTIRRLKQEGFDTKPQVRAEMLFLSSIAQPKIDYVKNITEKALVFSQYTQVLEVYEKELKNAGKRVLYYHGKLSMKQRLEVLERWANNEADILLLSLMTARYGLNLTQATRTIFLEPPTSLAILEQCEDRVHRIGQTKACRSDLLCCSELDEAALENIVNKQEAIDKLKPTE